MSLGFDKRLNVFCRKSRDGKINIRVTYNNLENGALMFFGKGYWTENDIELSIMKSGLVPGRMKENGFNFVYIK